MTILGSLPWSLLLLAPMFQDAATIPQEVAAKLDGGLADRISKASDGEFLPVDIILTEQTAQTLITAASKTPDKHERRLQVISLLKETAAHSQGPIVSYLEGKRDEGLVRGDIRRLWLHNVVTTQVAPAVALELAARSDVALVHYDPPRGEEVLVSAPMQTAGGTPTCGLNLIGAPQVWSQLGVTGKGVVVGVIDTGLCAGHPDIAGQIWRNPGEIPSNGIDDEQNGFIDDIRGWNFESHNNNTNDQNSHGSHTSGTVAGDGTGGNQCGVAPDARIMVLKFFNDFSGEQSVWDCMQYGVDNGADVLTASLGWPHSFSPQRATWRAICENTIAAGVVVCYAAGNEGCSTQYDNVRTPGDVPSVITVGAVDCNDTLAWFSSCGPVTWQSVPPYNDYPYPPGLTKPDVSAPGVATLSHNLCNGYVAYDGTSMATPHVAGVAALLLQADPSLDHFGVKAILEATAVDRGAAGKDNQYGAGRLNAFAAVQSAISNGNFCVAKATSCLTTPEIDSAGIPSATATSGFVVTASGMRAHQVGMLMYTDAGWNNAPFLGGHLCIQGINRTVLVNDTFGTPGFCDGELSIDMNSFRAGLLGGPPPLPSLSTPGTTVHCQFFGRDPGNTFNAVLTAGLKYVVTP
jgi:serine protease AprX